MDQAEAPQPPFHVVEVDEAVVQTVLARPAETLHQRFGGFGKPPEPRISIGDTLGVSIWEAAGGSLFGQPATEGTSGGSRNVSLPEQVVQADGAISVPFAGRVPVAGRTLLDVQQEIEKRLQAAAVQPQAIITIAKSVANSVTVSGEVVNGARVPLSPYGDRLLDMIAAAGGARAPVYETFVRLSRQGATATIPLESLIDDPAENIFAWPGDVLTLIRDPQTFEAFGATGKNAEVNFESRRMTLAQALAKSSGLLDERADPDGVFLFRPEPEPFAEKLGAPAAAGEGPHQTVPIIYHVNMRLARSFFLAQQFPMENHDVLYVANASSNELQKFFQLLGTLTGPVFTGIVVKNSAP